MKVEKKPAVVKPFESAQEEENKNCYSVYTQYQYNNLNNELNQMENNLHTVEQRDQVLGIEIELILMQKRLQSIQQQSYVREMQESEMNRIRSLQTYPYSSLNVDDDLYLDSLNQFKQEEERK